MPLTIDPFYLWGAVVAIVILAIGTYTYKEVSRANRQKQRRRNIYRNGVFDALRARDDGSLYTLIKRVSSQDDADHSEDAGDEVAAATRTLMIWTAVLASATVLMAYFAYFTLDAIHGQLNEMRLEQRAWIKVSDPALDSDLVYNKDIGDLLSFHFIITNIGKTVAFNVRPTVRLYTPDAKDINFKEVCEEWKRGSDEAKNSGVVLLPGTK